MKQVNTQGIKSSNTASDHIPFDKLVVEDSFSEVYCQMIRRKLAKSSKNVTINGLGKFP